jgi:hypothetical protein
MRRSGFLAAVAIVMLANGLALTHAARNRMGAPDAELTLTNRELSYFRGSTPDDDSGVTLHLGWTDPGTLYWPAGLKVPDPWLGVPELQRLGFDCSVDPASPDAERHYERQRPRQVFVAMEYGGSTWRSWLEFSERAVAEQRVQQQFLDRLDGPLSSHLIPVDADLDAHKLRARHPDRGTVVIVPAAVAITIEPYPYAGARADPRRPARIVGRIRELPSAIHVPRPFSDEFRRIGLQHKGGAIPDLSYRVRLSYGALHEPWITAVEFTK